MNGATNNRRISEAAADAPLPGAIGMSRLQVYPWPADDGLHGGTPHLHLACTECYLVLSGEGELHTLTMNGLERTPLRPGDAVWFTPGTIHRAVNGDDALRVQVLMQNDGLPEAGDAVLTFPPDQLADPATYRAAVSLEAPDERTRQQRARRRRDLAVEGFTTLCARVEAGDVEPLRDLYRAAAALVADRLETWEGLWRAAALRTAERTGEQISALRRGDTTHLEQAGIRTLGPLAGDVLGMCGFLAPYRD